VERQVPVEVTLVTLPANAVAGTSTWLVSLKDAVGNESVWRPSVRNRPSRCDLSDEMEVVSTSIVAAVIWTD